ncbi:hypothetical protein LSAT2_020908, partial [Lamellibrachia satsuma]
RLMKMIERCQRFGQFNHNVTGFYHRVDCFYQRVAGFYHRVVGFYHRVVGFAGFYQRVVGFYHRVACFYHRVDRFYSPTAADLRGGDVILGCACFTPADVSAFRLSDDACMQHCLRCRINNLIARNVNATSRGGETEVRQSFQGREVITTNMCVTVTLMTVTMCNPTPSGISIRDVNGHMTYQNVR